MQPGLLCMYFQVKDTLPTDTVWAIQYITHTQRFINGYSNLPWTPILTGVQNKTALCACNHRFLSLTDKGQLMAVSEKAKEQEMVKVRHVMHSLLVYCYRVASAGLLHVC